MSRKEVFNKAYGHIPKETTPYFDVDWVPNKKLFPLNKKLQLFILQMICHVALIWALFNFTLANWLVCIMFYFMSSCLGGSITLHRYFSHKSFEFKHKWVERLFTLFAAYSLSGDPMSWVNNHRQHHRFTDKPGDPHSPAILGFWKVQFASMLTSYDKLRFVPNMVRDEFLRKIHQYYYIFHWTFLTALVLINWKLACVIYLVPSALVWIMGSLINTVCHTYGYRNYETQEHSTNNFLLGYTVWGEGWHNNHHGNPANANFGKHWWEFDISYQIIKLISK